MAMFPIGQHDKNTSTAQLREDLHHLSRTVEELVNATAEDSRSNVKEMRDRAQRSLKETRGRLEARGEKFYHDTRDGVLDSADLCDRYVHENPWTSIGVGTAVGVVLGLLLGRR